jgi:hypothetical protein
VPPGRSRAVLQRRRAAAMTVASVIAATLSGAGRKPSVAPGFARSRTRHSTHHLAPSFSRGKMIGRAHPRAIEVSRLGSVAQRDAPECARRAHAAHPNSSHTPGPPATERALLVSHRAGRGRARNPPGLRHAPDEVAGFCPGVPAFELADDRAVLVLERADGVAAERAAGRSSTSSALPTGSFQPQRSPVP